MESISRLSYDVLLRVDTSGSLHSEVHVCRLPYPHILVTPHGTRLPHIGCTQFTSLSG